jgi:uncharacterized protein YcaQ
MRQEIAQSFARLQDRGLVQPCALVDDAGTRRPGWIRAQDLELATRLERIRPRSDVGVLLSPFDPVLWDRQRVQQLFGFHQVLEIFKPAVQRMYGYFCLSVLAGEHLVGRCDLKADRKNGRLHILSLHHEDGRGRSIASRAACRSAIDRFAEALRLTPVW